MSVTQTNFEAAIRQIDRLEAEIANRRSEVRQAIVQDLIRSRSVNQDPKDLIEEATLLCTFIESGIPTAKPSSVKTKAKKIAKPTKTGKRKYTKRSKFWGKKKSA